MQIDWYFRRQPLYTRRVCKANPKTGVTDSDSMFCDGERVEKSIMHRYKSIDKCNFWDGLDTAQKFGSGEERKRDW